MSLGTPRWSAPALVALADLKGAWLMAKESALIMKANEDGGSIINIVSILGVRPYPWPAEGGRDQWREGGTNGGRDCDVHAGRHSGLKALTQTPALTLRQPSPGCRIILRRKRKP